jgi:hypothetical protein
MTARRISVDVVRAAEDGPLVLRGPLARREPTMVALVSVAFYLQIRANWQCVTLPNRRGRTWTWSRGDEAPIILPQAWLATHLGVSQSTVSTSLRAAVKAGLLQVAEPSRHWDRIARRYRFNLACPHYRAPFGT